MFFHFQIFVYSLIYFVFLQVVSGDLVIVQSDFFVGWRALLSFVVFFLLLGYFYQVAKKVSRKSSATPIPVLMVVSTAGLLFFVQSEKQMQFLILLAALAYYFLHIALYRLRCYEGDKTAKGIVAAGSVSTIFLFYAVAYGVYLNFAISLWILMMSLMAVTFFVTYQYLLLINENKKIVLNYSMVLGFVMAEIVWILNFWPFGYLTTGVISLIFYYVFWDIIQRHFLDELSKRRVIANMLIFGLLITLVLTSTRWLPVV